MLTLIIYANRGNYFFKIMKIVCVLAGGDENIAICDFGNFSGFLIFGSWNRGESKVTYPLCDISGCGILECTVESLKYFTDLMAHNQDIASPEIPVL